jgi:tight adherence protein B
MALPLIFFGLLTLSFLLLFLLSGPSGTEKRMRRRLDVIRVSPREESNEPTMIAAVAPTIGRIERLSAVLERFHLGESLTLLIRHSATETTVGTVVLTSVALAVGATLLARSLSLPLPLVCVAGVAGAGARYLLLVRKRSKRLKKFTRALPDAIELMARALRAGHSMASSIEIIAEQSPIPLSSEFAICFQQQKFGIPLRDALLEMGERVPSRDLHFLITAVLVQKETGGDLTEILDRTTVVIRERVRIEGEIKTYTAQGRLTGWILSCLPGAMLMLINVITPGYSHILFYDPLGQKLLYAGATCIGIGALIIRKIVDIRV